MDPINLDAILADATPAEAVVPLCLNGNVRRRYEEVAERIADRRRQAEAADLSRAAAAVVDDRLGRRAGSGPDREPVAAPAVRDAEQDLLEQIERQMRAATVPFLLRAIPSQQWGELVEKHPPRKDPGTGRIDPRDLDGVNVKTFYPELVKLSIAGPAMDDAQYERVMGVLSDAQFNRLAKAAGELNVQDDDIPFSLSGSENPPS